MTFTYKILVRGQKNSCYAFYGSLPCCYKKKIAKVTKINNKYVEMLITGCAKKHIDQIYHNKKYDYEMPILLPDNYKKAEQNACSEYIEYCLQSKSKMFSVEVFATSINGKYSEDYQRSYYYNGENLEYYEWPKYLKF